MPNRTLNEWAVHLEQAVAGCPVAVEAAPDRAGTWRTATFQGPLRFMSVDLRLDLRWEIDTKKHALYPVLSVSSSSGIHGIVTVARAQLAEASAVLAAAEQVYAQCYNIRVWPQDCPCDWCSGRGYQGSRSNICDQCGGAGVRNDPPQEAP